MRKAFLSLAMVLFLAASPSASPQAFAQWYVGDGGRGITLGVVVPESSGLSENQAYLPLMVQGGLVSSISKYSAISVMDRVSLDRLIAETLDPVYEDDWDVVRLGHVTQLGHILTGKLTRTLNGYSVYFNISDTKEGRTRASYSAVHTSLQLEDLSAVQVAAKELLLQMGVRLTDGAMAELGSFPRGEVLAQQSLAQGILAQQRGTTIEALTHYVNAISYDQSLAEAVQRVSVYRADIAGANLGQNALNDIRWRNEWVARLLEFELYYRRYVGAVPAPPYTLVYTTDVRDMAVNYQANTASLSFEVFVYPVAPWYESINAVYRILKEGLDATGRAAVWGLDWPDKTIGGVPFGFPAADYVTVTGVLTNSKGVVLSTQNLRLPLKVRSELPHNLLLPRLEPSVMITFTGVDVNAMTDVLSIDFRRNEAINILPVAEYERMQEVNDYGLSVANVASYTYDFRNNIRVTVTKSERQHTNRIPYGVTHIEMGVLTGEVAILPPTVVRVLYEREYALNTITIGANVTLMSGFPAYINSDARLYTFREYYNANGQRAGTYVYNRGWALVNY